ncbi:NHL repeat-containing protein [bacterium]|nr:NHL repeat-containing protein [bacterium]
MTKADKTIKIVALIATTICLLCWTTQLTAQKIEIKNGIKFVHNEGKGLLANSDKLQLHYKGTLGSMDDEDENYMFYIPFSITGNDSAIYVLDTGNHRVQQFDKDYNFIRSFGRRGQGPAEFLTPNEIMINPEGDVIVNNSGNQRLEFFSLEGEYLQSIRCPSNLFYCNYLSSSELIIRNRKAENINYFKNRTVPLLFKLDEDMQKIQEIGSITYDEKYEKYSGAYRFSFTIDNNDNIYVTFLFQNRIEKYDKNGKFIFRMDRPVSKKFPAKYRNKVLWTPGSKGIAIDNKGRIWAASRKKFAEKSDNIGMGMVFQDGSSDYYIRGKSDITESDHYTLECFDSNGILLKIFTLSHWLTDLTIIGDKIYVLDQLRTMQYHIYDIVDLW